MLASHAFGLHERCDSSSSSRQLEDPVSDIDEESGGGEDSSGKVLFRASFDELGREYVKYDTIIWVLISMLLVLAWGIGLIMLLYLPVRRYVLLKEVSSRKLIVTPREVVYRATRPSYIPFLGSTKIEKHIALILVIDIIIEQGCLQSIYGIHTFRLESIAHGKAAPVDELQIQGVSNPELLRKVIITEAAKNIREIGSRKSKIYGEFESPARMRSLSEIPTINKMSSPGVKIKTSPSRLPAETGGMISGDLLLNKLEEVKLSVEKIESLVAEHKHS